MHVKALDNSLFAVNIILNNPMDEIYICFSPHPATQNICVYNG